MPPLKKKNSGAATAIVTYFQQDYVSVCVIQVHKKGSTWKNNCLLSPEITKKFENSKVHVQKLESPPCLMAKWHDPKFPYFNFLEYTANQKHTQVSIITVTK